MDDMEHNSENEENEELHDLKGSQDTRKRRRRREWRVVDGWYGWVVTFISFVIFIFSGGVFYSGGIVIPELMSAFPDTGTVAATLLISLEFSLMNFLCLFAGCMTEVYGCRVVSLFGSFFVALGFICSSFVTVFSALYFTYSTLLGLGMALQFVPCVVLVQQYFTRHRVLASGIVSAGSPAGVFIFAVLIRWFMDTFAWRGTLLLMGGINLNALPLVSLLRPPKDLNDNIVSNGEEVQVKKTPSFMENMRKTLWTLRKSITELSEPKIALTFIACFLKCLEYNVPYIFLPMKITHLGYSPWHAAMAVASLGIGDLFSRLFIGAIGSFKSVNNVLLISIVLLLGGASEVTSGLLSNFYALCVCGFFTTAFSGMFVTIRPPMLVDLVGIDRVARIFGLMNIGDGFGNLAGLPLLAFLHKYSGNINVPFFTCSIGPIIASLLIFIIFMMPHARRSSKT